MKNVKVRLKQGGYGLNRDLEIIGPFYKDEQGYKGNYPFFTEDDISYTKKGESTKGKKSILDIILALTEEDVNQLIIIKSILNKIDFND